MSDTERERASDPPGASSLPAWAAWPLRALAALAGLVAAATLGVLIMAAIALAVAYPNLPEISGLTDYRPKLPMRVLSADGVLLGEFGEERRNFTPIAEIPKVMQQAVLAIEDSRRYRCRVTISSRSPRFSKTI